MLFVITFPFILPFFMLFLKFLPIWIIFTIIELLDLVSWHIFKEIKLQLFEKNDMIHLKRIICIIIYTRISMALWIRICYFELFNLILNRCSHSWSQFLPVSFFFRIYTTNPRYILSCKAILFGKTNLQISFHVMSDLNIFHHNISIFISDSFANGIMTSR